MAKDTRHTTQDTRSQSKERPVRRWRGIGIKPAGVRNFCSFVLVCGLLSVVCGLCGCERIDAEALNKMTKDDPWFNDVLARKQELDSKIILFLSQLRNARMDTNAQIRTLQENFNRRKSEIDMKIAALKNELEPERAKLKQDAIALRESLSGKKEMLKSLAGTKRNLTNLINQQRAVNVTAGDMAKWQERLADLDNQLGPLEGEVREMEENLRLMRLKLIALRQ